jgi:hypothetical protein
VVVGCDTDAVGCEQRYAINCQHYQQNCQGKVADQEFMNKSFAIARIMHEPRHPREENTIDVCSAESHAVEGMLSHFDCIGRVSEKQVLRCDLVTYLHNVHTHTHTHTCTRSIRP